ncbi:MAG: NUDIX domain-containing protein [Patescibacteria group bacterium]|nr:NUDIX domain-containing protein [Patescibacteria group bacterium]
MKLLKTINFSDISKPDISQYRIRTAARAVVVDAENKLALLFVSAYGYHKLPGGGVEVGETIIQALKRECLEEIGCDIIVGQEVGAIIEIRTKLSFKQESFCFLAKVAGPKRPPKFDPEEIAEGLELKWVAIDEAIKLIKGDKSLSYRGKFIRDRDLTFLTAAVSQLGLL